MSSIYEAHPGYLQSKRWQTIRRWRLRWDGGRCRACHSADRLEIHHARYIWFSKAWWFGPVADDCPWWMLPEVFWLLRRIGMLLEARNTITLCKRCHGAVHGAQRIAEFRD